MKKTAHKRFCLFILLLALFGGSSFAQKSTAYRPPVAGVTEMYDYLVQYQADRGSLLRFYIIQGSPERRERLLNFYKDYLAILDKLPFESYSTGGKADWLLLKRDIESEIFELQEESTRFEKTKGLVSTGSPLYELEKLCRRGKHLDSEKVSADLIQTARKMEGELKNLGKINPLPSEEATHLHPK